jgi:hypothetical protein
MAVNHGQREIRLAGLGAVYSGERESVTSLYREDGWEGLPLAENGYWHDLVQLGDAYTQSPDGDIAVDLFFVDTLGCRHPVKDAKRLIDLLSKAPPPA